MRAAISVRQISLVKSKMKLQHSYWTIAWIFHVKPGKQRVFRRTYGPAGNWAQLFAKDPHYMGTDLLHHPRDTRCYLTIDRWTSRAAYHRFKKQHRKEYAALDARCETLTLREIKIGEFPTGGGPQAPNSRKVRSPSRFARPNSG
jgi:heme-degrading monooxygenase HmoA